MLILVGKNMHVPVIKTIQNRNLKKKKQFIIYILKLQYFYDGGEPIISFLSIF